MMTLEEVRDQFPHTGSTIYMNHAATGPLSRPVANAINEFIRQRQLTDIDNFERWWPTVDETRMLLAEVIGSDFRRIEFAPNTSYGLNILAHGLEWKPGDRIAIPGCEFPANVYPFLALEKLGVSVDFIPHREGTIARKDIEKTLTARTRLLAISWVQFLSGFRIDLGEIAALCRERGVLLSVDAIQGLGALKLDEAKTIDELGIDFLATGCHKWMMATQGIGFFWMSEALDGLLKPSIVGWSGAEIDWDHLDNHELQLYDDASRFRVGTLNSMGITALKAAVQLYLEAGRDQGHKRVLDLARALASGFDAQGLHRYGTSDAGHASGIVTIKHGQAEDLVEHLRNSGIDVALRNRMVRFSPSYYNTLEEVDRVVYSVRRFHTANVAT